MNARHGTVEDQVGTGGDEDKTGKDSRGGEKKRKIDERPFGWTWKRPLSGGSPTIVFTYFTSIEHLISKRTRKFRVRIDGPMEDLVCMLIFIFYFVEGLCCKIGSSERGKIWNVWTPFLVFWIRFRSARPKWCETDLTVVENVPPSGSGAFCAFYSEGQCWACCVLCYSQGSYFTLMFCRRLEWIRVVLEDQTCQRIQTLHKPELTHRHRGLCT